jgi:serine/threonine protein kinase
MEEQLSILLENRLTYCEEESVRDTKKLMKEVGKFSGEFSFDLVKTVQSIIENDQRHDLLKMIGFNESLSETKLYINNVYNMALDYMVDTGKQAREKIIKTEQYVNMPEFETVEMLGSGDFGEVYLIVKRDQNDSFTNDVNRKVLKDKKYFYTIKHIKYPDDSKQWHDLLRSRLVESIKTERETGYYLSHPNITKLFGCYRTNHFAVLIHEYICCGNITAVLNDGSHDLTDPLHRKRLNFYSAQLLMALEYLNRFKLNHCDIKEDNMCLDYRGYLKLIDFGSIRHFEQKLDVYSGIRN